MAWRAIARSSIGTSHQKQDMPCQDYGGCKILNDVIVGAVADGAGSAKYSDIGAKLAVKTALEYLTEVEEWLQDPKHFWQLTEKPFSEEEAKELFANTAKKVVTALEEQAASDGYSVDDLACTLLVIVATPNWVAAMQIGDGLVVVRCQQEDHQLLFQPDKGEYINETTFVTSAKALDTMRVCVRSGKQEFICAATDGLERVAIRMSDWTPFAPFFKPLEEYLREINDPEQEDEYLMSFLDSDRLNTRTDDDKTLLLCLYDSPNSR
jgi:serine/threonine protein phosphatase PrpC